MSRLSGPELKLFLYFSSFADGAQFLLSSKALREEGNTECIGLPLGSYRKAFAGLVEKGILVEGSDFEFRFIEGKLLELHPVTDHGATGQALETVARPGARVRTHEELQAVSGLFYRPDLGGMATAEQTTSVPQEPKFSSDALSGVHSSENNGSPRTEDSPTSALGEPLILNTDTNKEGNTSPSDIAEMRSPGFGLQYLEFSDIFALYQLGPNGYKACEKCLLEKLDEAGVPEGCYPAVVDLWKSEVKRDPNLLTLDKKQKPINNMLYAARRVIDVFKRDQLRADAPVATPSATKQAIRALQRKK